MSFFTATLAPATTLSNVRYRFFNEAGALAVAQTSGITQPIAGIATFVISSAVPAGAVLLHVYDNSNASNYIDPIALNFARGDEFGAATLTSAERTSIATALLDLANVVGTRTVRQILRLLAALAGAKTSNGGATVRDLADTKNVIDAVIDGSGNRTSVTLDLN